MNESILIVEDEPGVLDFLSDALRDLGYETIGAADTTSALALVEQGEHLDDVLVDKEIMALRPGVDRQPGQRGQFSSASRTLYPPRGLLFCRSTASIRCQTSSTTYCFSITTGKVSA